MNTEKIKRALAHKGVLMFKLTVLGSSASLPSPRHRPSCFALTCGGVYLLDACEGVQTQLMRYRVGYGKLKAIFISHLHADHFLGVPGLVQTLNMGGRTEPLFLFGPRGTRKLFEELFSIRQFQPNFPIITRDCIEGECHREKLFTVSCFPVEHGCPAIGFVIEEPEKTRFHEAKAKKLGIKGRLFTELSEKGSVKVGRKTVKLKDVSYCQPGKKIVYTGDTKPCKAVVDAAKGADLLIHDSAFSHEDRTLAAEKKHSTAKQAAEDARKAKVKKLLLTHFSNRYDDRTKLLEEARVVFAESDLGVEGAILNI